MCTLTFCKPGFTPKKDYLVNSCENNPDGFGYGILVDEKIIVGKDMEAEKIIEEFLVAREMYPDAPAIFHSRIGTHGVRDVSNCHPFWSGDDGQTIVAHNGVMQLLTDRVDEDGKVIDVRSDTRIFAEDYLPKFGLEKLADYQMVDMMEDWLGNGNKVVVLTHNPAILDGWIILNEHRGSWEDGIWWSNGNYRYGRLVPQRFVPPPKNYNYKGNGWMFGKEVVRTLVMNGHTARLCKNKWGVDRSYQWFDEDGKVMNAETFFEKFGDGVDFDPKVGEGTKVTDKENGDGKGVEGRVEVEGERELTEADYESILDGMNEELDDEERLSKFYWKQVCCPCCGRDKDSSRMESACDGCGTCFCCGEETAECRCSPTELVQYLSYYRWDLNREEVVWSD